MGKTRFGRRVIGWLRLRREAAALAEEIEQHRALVQSDLESRGMASADAAAASRRAMGNTRIALEDARDVWVVRWIDRLWREVRYGVRGLRREPAFAAAAILTVGLGIGTTTTVFSVADAELWRPLPLPNPQQLVAVSTRAREPRASNDGLSGADLIDWRAGAPAFSNIAASGETTRRTMHLQTAESVVVADVTPNYFSTLGRRAVAGLLFDRATACGPRPGVVTERAWRRLFNAEPTVVGRTVRLDDDNVSICGVVGADDSLGDDPDLFIALDEGGAAFLDRARPLLVEGVFGRLQPDATPDVARAQIGAVLARLAIAYPAGRTGRDVYIRDLREAHRSSLTARPLYFLLGASLVVLALSATNVAALLLSRALRRRPEFALRGALGGGQAALARQLLVEGALLAVPGGALGVLVAMWATGFFTSLSLDSLLSGENVPVDLRAWAFATAVTTLTTAVCVLVPLLLARRIDLSSALGSGQRTDRSAKEGRARFVLLTAQVALTVVLLAGAGIFVKSFIALTHIPLGFDPADLVSVRAALSGPRYDTDAQVTGFAFDLLSRVRAVPGVVEAAVGTSSPLASGPLTGLARGDRPRSAPGQEERGILRAVSPRYFQTLRIDVIKGREFLDTDTAGAPRVGLINQEAAKKIFGGEDPVGQLLDVVPYARASRWVQRPGVVQIVGVVANVKDVLINGNDFPNVYLPFTQAPAASVEVVLRTRLALADLRAPVKQAGAQTDAALPIAMSTLDARVTRALRGDRFNALLVSTFAGAALLLAMVGIYGAIAYAVAGRTREFGVRLALGAPPAQLVRATLWQSGRVGVIGGVLGIAATVAIARAVGNAWYSVPGSHNGLLYQVTITDPATLSAAFIGIIVVALAAAAIPARRVGRVDPVRALRSE